MPFNLFITLQEEASLTGVILFFTRTIGLYKTMILYLKFNARLKKLRIGFSRSSFVIRVNLFHS